MVLTDRFLTFYNKQRPVDILQRMLYETHGDVENHQREFLSIFERYGLAQSCAMCLDIICTYFTTNSNELGIVKPSAYTRTGD